MEPSYEFDLGDYEHSFYLNANLSYFYDYNGGQGTTGYWSWNVNVVIAMAVLGTITNAALLLVILLNQHLRSTSNILVGNLAVADLVMFALAVPSDVTHWTVLNWPDTVAGQFLCKASASTMALGQVLSVTSLTAVSIERFCSLRRKIQLKRTAVILVTVWAISVVSIIPIMVWSQVTRYTSYTSLCHFLPLSGDVGSRGFLTAFFVLTYLLPLLIITFCYMGMATILTRGGAGAPSQAVRARRRLAITVFILNVVFAVCWLPYHGLIMLFLYGDIEAVLSISVEFFMNLVGISHVLVYVNSLLNPLVVFAISAMHRKPLMDFLLCRRFRKQSGGTDQGPGDRYARFQEDVFVSDTEYIDEKA